MLVGELEVVARRPAGGGGVGAGADDLAAAGQGEEPVAGDRPGGGVEGQLLAGQVEGGCPVLAAAGGVLLQQQRAGGVVDVAGGGCGAGAGAGGVVVPGVAQPRVPLSFQVSASALVVVPVVTVRLVVSPAVS